MQTCARKDGMPTLRAFFDPPDDDDELLLRPKNKGGRYNAFPRIHRDSAIAKGVANQLERWPSHLFFAFLAACLILTSLIVFVFVAAAFYLPITDDNRWQNVEGSFHIGRPTIYFVKNENRTWSTWDLCYIETAARDNPDLDVYLINVMRHNPRIDRFNAIMIRLLGDGNDKAKTFLGKVNYITDSRRETDAADKLISANRNIRSVDISIDKLFYRSQLLSAVNDFNEETLETATKVHLLWNTPGITLNTNAVCNLKRIREFLCTTSKNCTLDTLVTIDPENGIIATNVPCQAFLGFFIRQLADTGTQPSTNQPYLLKQIFNEFCPKDQNCPGIRMFKSESECLIDGHNCPNVYTEYPKTNTDSPSVVIT